MEQSIIVGIFALTGAALGGVIGFIGLLVINTLKAKKEKVDFLILRLEEISENVDKILYDDMIKISSEIRYIIKGLPTSSFDKDIPNLRFRYRASTLMNLYFRNSLLEKPYNNFIELYQELISRIRFPVIEKNVSNYCKAFSDSDASEIVKVLDDNHRMCVESFRKVREAIFLCGDGLMKERVPVFWSWFRCCK